MVHIRWWQKAVRRLANAKALPKLLPSLTLPRPTRTIQVEWVRAAFVRQPLEEEGTGKRPRGATCRLLSFANKAVAMMLELIHER